MTTKDPKKWAVSRNRNATLSRSAFIDGETERYRTLSNSIQDLKTEGEVINEIDKLWVEAQEKFLAIGRYLALAKQRFHRTFEATILPQLPFGKGVAFQLRAVATAVDEGRILEEELPLSYATAYQLVSLPLGHLDLARTQNLVHRNVLRREVEAFRAKMRADSEPARDFRLIHEWRRLNAEIARLSARTAEIEQQIGPELRAKGLLKNS